MTSAAPIQSIRVDADPTRVLSLLSKTFTRGTTVLGELLQNARRAGATRVDITVNDELIEFRDDGIGIADFSVLLAVAKSGWSEAIIQHESAYGAGFLATLFCCERIEVRSRGAMIAADTADLIAMKPTLIQQCDDEGSTIIRLHQPRIKTARGEPISESIRNLSLGFPIPVVLNGESLPRPHAIDAQSFATLDIGLVSPHILAGHSPTALYLQGLPIGPAIHTGFPRSSHEVDFNAPPPVIHLDPILFQGRMPDRDTLIEPEAAHQRIRTSIEAAARERLLKIAATMTPEAFVSKYANMAVWLDLRDLLNGIDVVPAKWLYRYVEMPSLFDIEVGESRESATSEGLVSRAEVEAIGLYNCESTNQDGYDDLAAIRYVHAKGAYCGHSAPDWHWLAALSTDLCPEDIRIAPGSVLGEDSFDIYYAQKLNVFDTLSLQRVDDDGEPFGDSVRVPSVFNAADSILYVSPGCDCWEAVSLISSFSDGGETLIEADRDRAAQNLRVARDGILHSNPADLFHSLIREHGLSATLPKAIRGKTFTVSITDDGVVSVT